MGQISLRAVAVVGAEPLFRNLDLVIADGDRVGLVAGNGGGKSTLLRCLAGSRPAHGGDHRPLARHARRLRRAGGAGRLLDLTLAEAVAGRSRRDERESAGLARRSSCWTSWRRRPNLRHRPVAHSAAAGSAWRCWRAPGSPSPTRCCSTSRPTISTWKRSACWKAWLTSPLRDVPMVVASHDRQFLEAVTNRTLFLRPENSPLFALPYSRAREALVEVDASMERQYERDMKAAQQLRRQAAKLKNIGINSGSDLLVVKTKQLKERAERLEEAAAPAHRERSAGAIKLANRGTHAKLLVSLDDVPVTTPSGEVLFKTGKIGIAQGDRIVLLGGNGVGKSCLIELIRRAVELPDAVAGAKVTPSVVLGYGDQALEQFGGKRTPFDLLNRGFELGDQRVRSLLAGAGIAMELQDKPLAVLSGGQKARLMLLTLRLTNPNFYLLDEPTNHLDIDGQETLEEELLKHEASCVLASHDRSFIRAIGNRFWLIDRRRLVEVDSPEPFFEAAAGVSPPP
jgi:ATPase subunit of ABC transporter with duplicated ATPase domains